MYLFAYQNQRARARICLPFNSEHLPELKGRQIHTSALKQAEQKLEYGSLISMGNRSKFCQLCLYLGRISHYLLLDNSLLSIYEVSDISLIA